MIVEGLTPDPRRPGSTRVVIDGRPAWTVPAEVIEAIGLVPGQAVRGETVERLDQAAEEEGAVRAALRALERRAHGETELARKLERRGHDPAAIAAAIARLRRMGLLDDLAFARLYIASRTERGRGPIRLRQDLARLGVDRDAAARAMAELVADVADPLQHPRALAARRARQVAALPVETRRRRLIAYLGRRGYRGSEARAIVEEAIQS